MNDVELGASVPNPSLATSLRRLALALATAVGLYAAPFAYFLTACSDQAIEERFEWFALMAALVVWLFPVFVALGVAIVVGIVFVVSRDERSIRIRNYVIPSAIAAIAVGASLYGAIEPTRCTLF